MRSSDACSFSSNSPTYFDRNFPSFSFFFSSLSISSSSSFEVVGVGGVFDLDGRLLAYLVELDSNFRGHRFAASVFDPEDHVPRVVGDFVGPVRLLVQTRRRRGRRRLRQETIEQRQRDDDDDDEDQFFCPNDDDDTRSKKKRTTTTTKTTAFFFFLSFFL